MVTLKLSGRLESELVAGFRSVWDAGARPNQPFGAGCAMNLGSLRRDGYERRWQMRKSHLLNV
jgi:hypothetical protein